jgi:hypothetical protein
MDPPVFGPAGSLADLTVGCFMAGFSAVAFP